MIKYDLGQNVIHHKKKFTITAVTIKTINKEKMIIYTLSDDNGNEIDINENEINT